MECTLNSVDSHWTRVPDSINSAHRCTHETILPLLKDVQAYLKMLLENKMPGRLLVAAWENFYCVYDDLIRRFAVAQGVPHSDIDDCVQDVWIEVTTRLCEFNRHADRPGLRAWLYALVRSKAMNIFRRKIRRPADSLDQWMTAGQEPSDTQSDPATLLERQWEKVVLKSVIEELCEEVSTTNARILKMRLINRCNVDEVAYELNLASEQIHTRQHRMMKKLRIRMSLYTRCPIGSASP